MYGRLIEGLSRRAGVRFFRFFSRPLQPDREPVAPDTLKLQCLAEREVLALCGDAELDLSRQKVNAAFARGDLCVGAFDAGRLAGYCWLAFSPLPHLDGVWVDFDPEAVWTYKSLVRPSYRGRGLAAALYRFADDLCAKRGRRFSIVCVEAHNRASISAARRAGYVDAGYAAYLHPEERLLAWYSPAAKRGGVRFYRPENKTAV